MELIYIAQQGKEVTTGNYAQMLHAGTVQGPTKFAVLGLSCQGVLAGANLRAPPCLCHDALRHLCSLGWTSALLA